MAELPDVLDLDDTLTVSLDIHTALALRKSVIPGAGAFPGREFIEGFKHKVDDAILRFMDEPGLATVDLEITVREGWIIDRFIEFDGFGGPGTDLLIQLYRGFWGLRYGLPARVSAEQDADYVTKLSNVQPDGENKPEGLVPPDDPPNLSDGDFTISGV